MSIFNKCIFVANRGLVLSKQFFFLILLSLLMPYSSIAQNPFALHLSVNNGLPTNTFYNMTQDKKGYVWIAGYDGLFRYDGFRYKLYKSPHQTSTPGGNIQEDKYGRIWYENFDGFLYYVENDSLHTLAQNPPNDFVPFGISDQYLFVAQKKGIDIYDLKTLAFKQTISIPLDIPEHATTSGGAYYLMTDNVLYKIDTNLQLTQTNFFKDLQLKVKYVYPFLDRLYVISKNNEKQQLYFISDSLSFIKSIAIPHINYVQGSNVVDDKIVVYTPKGLFVYDDSGRIFLGAQGVFPNNSISSIFKDYQHNYWVGTTNDGVYIVPNLLDWKYTIKDHAPNRITKTKGGYLLGTRKGAVLKLNDQFGIERTLASNSEHLPVSYVHYDSTTRNIVYASRGFSYLNEASVSKEIKFNIALKQLVRIDDKYDAYAASGFCALVLNPFVKTSQTSVWDKLYEDNLSLKNQNTAQLLKGVRGKAVDFNSARKEIVFATNIGLYAVTPSATREILNDGSTFYASGVMWIGDVLYALDTRGTLFQVSDNGVFKELNSTLGLAPLSIKRIKKYNGYIVIVGNHIISVYNPLTGKIYQADVSIGSSEISDVLLEQDFFVVLTEDGIVKVHIADSLRKVAPRFYINNFLVNGVPLDWPKPLSLKYYENSVNIDFSLLEYIGYPIALHYRINNKEWLPIHSGIRNLEFASLSSGVYNIEFSIDGVTSPHVLHFEILAPFWKAWWFYMLCSLSIGLIVWLYYKRESKLMKRQIRLLNEKVVLEKNLSKSVLTSIKSQMNPHFFYNALNTIQAYIFTNDSQKANSYLAKFSKLTRTILEMSEQETISLSEEIEALTLYLELEKMRFKEGFEYTITVAESLDKESPELPPMLVQPYIENAIKHGLLHREQDRILKVHFDSTDSSLLVVIEDNGIGRKRSSELNKIKEEKHQSFSTKANEKRLEILNKRSDNKMAVVIIDKYDEEGRAVGTRVELTIPLN